ncbi:unannotated protein [freshwater metagenome]|uniref:Unannotated protein n=1 Tax=freshwater metagenome TaxID=449393 RepID=A0A6J6J687_9ZZZZ
MKPKNEAPTSSMGSQTLIAPSSTNVPPPIPPRMSTTADHRVVPQIRVALGVKKAPRSAPSAAAAVMIANCLRARSACAVVLKVLRTSKRATTVSMPSAMRWIATTPIARRGRGCVPSTRKPSINPRRTPIKVSDVRLPDGPKADGAIRSAMSAEMTKPIAANIKMNWLPASPPPTIERNATPAPAPRAAAIVPEVGVSAFAVTRSRP